MPSLNNEVVIAIFIYLSTNTLAKDTTITKDSSLDSNSRIYRGKDAPKNKYPFYIDLFITYNYAKDENGDVYWHII